MSLDLTIPVLWAVLTIRIMLHRYHHARVLLAGLGWGLATVLLVNWVEGLVYLWMLP